MTKQEKLLEILKDNLFILFSILGIGVFVLAGVVFLKPQQEQTFGESVLSLNPWVSSSSPFTALTVRTPGKNLYIPFSSATTSDLSIVNLASCDTIDTDAYGNLRCGTDATGAGGGDFAWTPTTNYGVLTNATSTPIWFQASPYSLFASSTAVLTYASTTALTVSETLFLGTATTTASNGIDISSGCFAVNGTCVSTSGFVPYTGATANLDLGAYDLSITNKIDTANRYLIDSGATTRIDWEAGEIYGSGGILSIDWENHTLTDITGSAVLDWNGDSILMNNASTTFLTVSNQLWLGTATTTGSNGFDITDGCYAIGGVCIAGTGGSGTVTSIATTYPLQGGTITTSGTLSLAFGTTTSNTWAGLQSFSNVSTTLLTVGVDDTSTGVLTIFGDNADSGARMRLYNSVNEDGTEEWWEMQAEGTQFNLGIEGSLDLFKFYSAGNFTAGGNIAGATYGSDASVSNAELLYINSLSSNAQTQLNAKQATLSATYPLILTGATLSMAFGTTTVNTFSALNTFANATTTLLSGTSAWFTNFYLGTDGQMTSLIGEGISITSGTTLGFDCSEVTDTASDAIGCSGENLVVDVTGDWTGTIDSVNFSNGTLAQNAIWVGGAAAIPSELALGTPGYILASSGGTLAYISTSTITVSGDIGGTLGALTIGADKVNDTHIDFGTGANQVSLGDFALTKGYFLVGNDASFAQATSTIFITSTGGIGIATTTPSTAYKMDVFGNARIDNTTANTTSTIRGGLEFVNTNNNSGCYFVFGTTAGATTSLNCY